MNGFWPTSLEGWLVTVGQVIVTAGIAWRLAMVQVDQRIAAAEKRVVDQINGMGGRVKRTEIATATLDERSRSTEADLKVMRDRNDTDMRAIAEKWGRLDERSRRGGGDAWGGAT
jgi:hypothetical protein